jgi:hypothetical protein
MAMKQSSRLVILTSAVFMLASQHGWIGQNQGQAEAAQTTKKSSTKKTTSKKPTQKKSYCGYPAPPNPAGMSDFCAMQYDLYCRRGVGCNQFGR